ncbi:polysaccharide deacetylase family protein [Chloroflexota bacterium]
MNALPLLQGLTGILVLIAVVVLFFRLHPGAIVNRLLPPVQPRLQSDKRYILFTFDTEEDWDGFSYFNSYRYIASGAFYQLVDGLKQRGVAATFYVTPSLVADMPEVLRHLGDNNHAIGVHLHPHNLIPVSYPYPAPYRDTQGDEIKLYSAADKKKLLEMAKEQLESKLGHQARLFRAGRHSCDCELEKMTKAVGFEAISNHKGNYHIEPVGLWNLDVGAGGILDPERFSRIDDLLALWHKERMRKIITFAAHPMRLYNFELGSITQGQPALLLDFVDYLRCQEGIEFITQDQLLDLLESGMR